MWDKILVKGEIASFGRWDCVCMYANVWSREYGAGVGLHIGSTPYTGACKYIVY